MPEMPTHSSIPSSYIDGITVTWVEVLPDYNASAGATVVYQFAGPEIFTVTGTGTGTSWAFALPSGKKPGEYAWQKKGTASSIASPLGCGLIKNVPSFSAAVATSWASVALAAAQTAFAALASGDIVSANINGESWTKESRAGLLDQIARLEAIVKGDADALKIQQGLGTGRRIMTRLDRYGLGGCPC